MPSPFVLFKSDPIDFRFNPSELITPSGTRRIWREDRDREGRGEEKKNVYVKKTQLANFRGKES